MLWEYCIWDYNFYISGFQPECYKCKKTITRLEKYIRNNAMNENFCKECFVQKAIQLINNAHERLESFNGLGT